MKDVTTMKKTELLECINKINSEVLAQAQNEKWKVSQLREWLSENLNEEEERNLSNTMKEYRKKYTKSTDYNGKPTLNNGDEIATALSKLAPLEVIKVAEKVLTLRDGELCEKYKDLNPGQQRMCSGNRIRFALKKGIITVKDVTKAITN